MTLNDFQKRQVRLIIKNAIICRRNALQCSEKASRAFCQGQFSAYVNSAKQMAWAFSFGGGK